ncbi:MAG: zinc-binding dehydrogenase [Coriobacteriales bacterium]|jgi:threonine dehydrogenase-like Zn-dependent dehydrogenase|nr:zinc-binding dehydrogenase [Coriobacteriales bacterium]
MATMKAGIYKGMLEAAIEEIERPEIGPGEILVKTVRSSICGSDINGAGVEPGKQFGHETAGWVAEVGKDVKDFKEGERVWVHPSRCVSSIIYTCQAGGFSEYIKVLNATEGQGAWHLPDNISWDEASLIEPFGVGTRGKNRPGAKPGDNVVVYGAGSIGLFCLSALVAQGIKPVVVDIVLSDYKRALLEKMGVIVAPLPEEGDKFEFLTDLWGTVPKRGYGNAINVDIVVDCAGAPNMVEEFFKLGKPDARLSIVGINMKPQDIITYQVMSSEGHILGSNGYDDEDIREVMDNLSSGRTLVNEIITHHFPFSELDAALKKAADKTEAIKVIVDME